MKQNVLLFIALISSVIVSCSKDKDQTATTGNPSKYITDPAKRKMITSLRDLDGGRIYTMNYTEDYQLQAAIDASTTDILSFSTCVSNLLYDVKSPY